MEHLKRPLEQLAKKFFVVANIMMKEQHGEGTNVVVGPFAVSIVAAMLFHAATGKTYDQLESILCFKQLFDGEALRKNILIAFREALRASTRDTQNTETEVRQFELNIANRIFVQQGASQDIRSGFLDDVKKYLNIDSVELTSIGPGAGVEAMTEWLEEHAGFINFKDLPPVVIDMEYQHHRLATLSVSYFRGEWQFPFDRSVTSQQLFHPDNSPPKNVDMMLTSTKVPYFEDAAFGLKYIEIPYFGNVASLIITMPTKKTMAEFVAGMSVKQMTDLRLKKKMTNVRVMLPRFQIQCSYDLEKFLDMLGFSQLKDIKPTLTHMTKNENFRASEGLISCAIQVDEEGTFVSNDPATRASRTDREAEPVAASSPATKLKFVRAMTVLKASRNLSATASTSDTPKSARSISVSAVPDDANVDRELFRGDRPFLLAVRHNRTSAILFSGCYLTPP